MGGPLKPGFGLSGDVQIPSNSVIPTGADHRKSGDLWNGGTLCLMITSNGWRSSQNGQRERAAGRPCPAVELPRPSQTRLEWATRPVLIQRPQQRLNFLPLLQGHGSFLPIFRPSTVIGLPLICAARFSSSGSYRHS